MLRNTEQLHPFSPKSGNFHFLITTEHDNLFDELSHGDVVNIKLEVWNEDEAVEFIKKILKINDTQQDADIKKLVIFLDYLPLALQLAAAYIQESDLKKKICDYVKIIQGSEEELRLLNVRPFIVRGYEKTILKIFHATIQMIRTNVADGYLADLILNLVSYFSNEDIPEKIFFNLNIKTKSMLTLTSAIKLLESFSLIISGNNETFGIHLVVQHVVKVALRDRNKSLRKALELLEDALETDKRVHYIPHAVSVWGYACFDNKLVEEFTELPKQIIRNLRIANRFKEFHFFVTNLLVSFKRIYGPNHSVTLDAIQVLAMSLESIGQNED